MILLETKYTRYQLRVTLYVCFLCISSGAFLGYTSSAVHSVSEDPTFPHLNVADIAWIGSLGPLGAVSGCLFTAAALPKFGPRRTILYFGSLCFFASWIGIYFAVSPRGIFISRFLGGLGAGITTSSAPLYVIGIASIKLRGRLGILPQLLMLFGIVVSYCLGSGLNWASHAMACCILVIPAFALLSLAPDTPSWLFLAGRTEDALSVLETLKDKSDATEEYDRLRNQELTKEFSPTRFTWRIQLVIKPVLTALGVMTFQQWTGISGVTFYAITIFKYNPSVDTWGAHIPAITLAVTQCIASLTSTFFIDRSGRKVLLLISASMTSLSSGSIGIYFLFGANESSLFWVPLFILITFAFGFGIGFGPVSWLIVTEILPEEIRHVINPFVLAYMWLCTFTITTSFPFLLEFVQIYGIFWIYSASSFLALFFIIFFVPETKGKSFEEVQKTFESGTNTKL